MRLGKGRKKYWQLYLLLIPAMIYLAIFQYGPMYGIILAFKDYKVKKGYLGSEWVGFRHFIRFFNHPVFWQMIKNTLAITLYNLATFPCAVILALLINEIRNQKFKKTVQMVTYAPHFLSTVVLCGIVAIFVGREGMLGRLVGNLTVGEPENLLQVADYFRSIYVWSGVWQNVGWGTIIYLSALAGIAPELIEAARIDGASRMQVIRHVNIPGILPTIAITFIMNTGSMLSLGFEKIYLLQNDLNLEVSNVLSTYVYDIGLQGGQFSYSTAISLFNNVVNILILIVVNRITKKMSGTGMW